MSQKYHSVLILGIRSLACTFLLTASSCSRPDLVPQKLSGIYFSESGHVLSVAPGGTVSLIPASSVECLPSGPHTAPGIVTRNEGGAVQILLPSFLPPPLRGSVVSLAPSGSSAELSWGGTCPNLTSVEAFGR